MKTVATLVLFVVFGWLTSEAQEQSTPAKPAPVPKRSAKAQVISFYAAVNEGQAIQGMMEMLQANPEMNQEDAQGVANNFASRMATMGDFIDFEILKETEVSARVKVLRTVAHFENQPFAIEFTFYDPRSGHWRLAHLKFDSNIATMFQKELQE